jgi:hypothetical protein
VKTVWKYPLKVTDEQVKEIPAGSTPLFVAEQNFLTLWMLVDDALPLQEHRIRVVGTGNPITFSMSQFRYAGSALMGGFVWHVWVEFVA